tara:strand:- start:10826 stop:11953 length:1128 start_codon:yes stop_codon:yes gene_type:complete
LLDDIVAEIASIAAPNPFGKRNGRVRKIVSISVALLLIIISMYLVNVLFKGEAAILYPKELRQYESEFYAQLDLEGIDYDGSGVSLCIVDSGIDMSHSAFKSLELKGWQDFVGNSEEPIDDNGHGTSMAGSIVADGHLKGIARGVDLYVAKALPANGQGEDQDVADAIDWCIAQSVDIISLSLGGSGSNPIIDTDGDRPSEDAAIRAVENGIYVVAAAGNDGGANDDGDVASPGNVELVISVGGINRDGTHWSGSSTGDNDGNFFSLPLMLPRDDPNMKPEVLGPGNEVPILMLDDSYGYASGTSSATAYVSGVLALMLEANPNLAQGDESTIESVKQLLMDTSKPKPGQNEHDDDYGYGIIQAARIIEEVESVS